MEEIIGIKIHCTLDGTEHPSRAAGKRYVREKYGAIARVYRKHPKRFLQEDKISRESWTRRLIALFENRQKQRKADKEVQKAQEQIINSVKG